MAVCEDIIAARDCGVVHCGLSALATPTVPQLAREFGLRDDPALYREIDDAVAGHLIRLILPEDMAYNSEIMSTARAEKFADQFLKQFGKGARYFTNGNFQEGRKQVSPTVWSGPSWDPVTDATFDTGVLAIGPQMSGCLWIEDED